MSESSTLYAKPSFITGIASILDFGATLSQYNYSESPEEADYKALRKDFEMVALDLKTALKNWEIENNVQEP